MAKPADKRADIWAFGVVFYELLTGERLFPGETVAETLAAVVRDTPDFSKLPAVTPPHVRRLLHRCLRKDQKTRLRDIGEARVWLDEPPSVDDEPAPRRNPWPWLVAGVMAVAALAFAWLWASRPLQESQRIQFSVAAPARTQLSPVSLPAVSPDGRYLAFVAGFGGRLQLWIRDLNALHARPIPESDGAVDPFWSPDSRFVAFFVPGKLKKVSAAAGPPVAICDAADGRGGSWNTDDVILFAPTFASPLLRVSAKGGTPVAVTALKESEGETSHRFPWFLPDGRHFLFSVRNASPEKTAVYLGELDSPERRLLSATASNAAYTPGFLLYMRGSALLAQRFNDRTLKLAGDTFPVAEPVDYLAGSIQGQFSVSQTGVLAYDSGGGSLQSQLTWMSREGKPLGTLGPRGVMQVAAISPAGDSAVVDRLDPSVGTYDLWLYDLARNLESRFTFDGGNDMYPVWSQDGASILFSSDRGGSYGIYRKAASGAQKEDLLYQSDGVSQPTDASGRYLLFLRHGREHGKRSVGLAAFGRRQSSGDFADQVFGIARQALPRWAMAGLRLRRVRGSPRDLCAELSGRREQMAGLDRGRHAAGLAARRRGTLLRVARRPDHERRGERRNALRSRRAAAALRRRHAICSRRPESSAHKSRANRTRRSRRPAIAHGGKLHGNSENLVCKIAAALPWPKPHRSFPVFTAVTENSRYRPDASVGCDTPSVLIQQVLLLRPAGRFPIDPVTPAAVGGKENGRSILGPHGIHIVAAVESEARFQVPRQIVKPQIVKPKIVGPHGRIQTIHHRAIAGRRDRGHLLITPRGPSVPSGFPSRLIHVSCDCSEPPPSYASTPVCDTENCP